MLTQRELTEKQARRNAILKEKEDILAKTKLHRENPTKEGNKELKTFITRSKELADELQKIDAELQADEVERGAQNIIIKKNKGGKENMNFENMTREEKRATTIYRDAFYKNIFKDVLQKQGVYKELSEDEKTIYRTVTDLNAESVEAGADVLLPLTTVNKIQSIMQDVGIIWDLIPNKTNFKGNVNLPIGSRTGEDPNADGVAQLKYTFTDLEIKQTAIIAEIKVQNLLLTNAIEDLENYLARESAKYLKEQLDFNVTTGNPVPGIFDGLLGVSVPEPYGAQVGDDPTYADIMATEGSMKTAYAKGARWLMNRKTYFNKFKTMTDPNGNLLASTIPFTQGNLASPMYLLDGVACDHSDDIPDNEFLLWNPNYYIVNVSKNITVSVNTSIYENKDQTAWYAKIYAGGRILFPEETVKYRIPTTV